MYASFVGTIEKSYSSFIIHHCYFGLVTFRFPPKIPSLLRILGVSLVRVQISIIGYSVLYLQWGCGGRIQVFLLAIYNQKNPHTIIIMNCSSLCPVLSHRQLVWFVIYAGSHCFSYIDCHNHNH